MFIYIGGTHKTGIVEQLIIIDDSLQKLENKTQHVPL